jgi:Transglutaminase-like superfamily
MMGVMARRAGVLLPVLLLGATTYAQVLHERVVVGGVRCANGVCWKEGRPAAEAAAILADGEIVPAPATGVAAQPGEPVYTPTPERAQSQTSATAGAPSPDAPPERRAHVAMDRETGPEPPGTRLYHEPFNPAVFPFKRMTALDAVLADESLTVAEASEARQRLRVVGADQREPGRDAFWGSIVIDFEPGKWVPLPSVATDVRILAARVEPEVELSFARDGADNQYVMSTAGGRHRLVWLSDAPQRYFAGAVPAGLKIGDEPRLPQAVPPVIRRRAARVIARLGLDARPTAPLNRAVDGLVAWFRAFQTGDPPRPTESTYVDLALGQKGSCRHRSYAFVITALAMGIPARYVENELHVFVEIYVPRVGWRRINLGGALVDERVAGAEGKVSYRPKGEDPFPQPPEFAHGTDATPPTPAALKEAGAGGGGAAGGGGRGARGTGAGAGGGAAGGVGRSEASGASGRARVDLERLDREVPEGTPGARVSHATVPTSIHVQVAARDAFRGERVEVAGVVETADGKPAGLPVEIYLDGPGGALRVGQAVAGADGSWSAAIEVPRDLPLGDHRVVARTPGDANRKPSRSR